MKYYTVHGITFQANFSLQVNAAATRYESLTFLTGNLFFFKNCSTASNVSFSFLDDFDLEVVVTPAADETGFAAKFDYNKACMLPAGHV